MTEYFKLHGFENKMKFVIIFYRFYGVIYVIIYAIV